MAPPDLVPQRTHVGFKRRRFAAPRELDLDLDHFSFPTTQEGSRGAKFFEQPGGCGVELGEVHVYGMGVWEGGEEELGVLLLLAPGFTFPSNRFNLRLEPNDLFRQHTPSSTTPASLPARPRYSPAVPSRPSLRHLVQRSSTPGCGKWYVYVPRQSGMPGRTCLWGEDWCIRVVIWFFWAAMEVGKLFVQASWSLEVVIQFSLEECM